MAPRARCCNDFTADSSWQCGELIGTWMLPTGSRVIRSESIRSTLLPSGLDNFSQASCEGNRASTGCFGCDGASEMTTSTWKRHRGPRAILWGLDRLLAIKDRSGLSHDDTSRNQSLPASTGKANLISSRHFISPLADYQSSGRRLERARSPSGTVHRLRLVFLVEKPVSTFPWSCSGAIFSAAFTGTATS